MKILTLWQPWASLIAIGLKQYETRSWGTKYRGKLAIHAAKRPAKDSEVEAIYDQLRALGGKSDDVAKLDELLGCYLMHRDELPYGCIVAIADLTDCLKMTDCSLDGSADLQKHTPAWQERHIWIESPSPLERSVGDWQPGRYAWKLENIIALPQPIYCLGGQGLRDVHEPLKSVIEQQLAA